MTDHHGLKRAGSRIKVYEIRENDEIQWPKASRP